MTRRGYECCACGQFFSSDFSFRKHRTGSYGEAVYDEKRRVTGYTKSARRCFTEAEMIARTFSKNTRGQWSMGTFDAEKAFGKKEEVEA